MFLHTSVLKKRHNDICYHMLRGYQDAGVLRFGWIPVGFDLEYLFTNTIMPGNKSHNLVESIFSNTASPIGGIEKV